MLFPAKGFVFRRSSVRCMLFSSCVSAFGGVFPCACSALMFSSSLVSAVSAAPMIFIIFSFSFRSMFFLCLGL